jgi:hypothetical protein
MEINALDDQAELGFRHPGITCSSTESGAASSSAGPRKKDSSSVLGRFGSNCMPVQNEDYAR